MTTTITINGVTFKQLTSLMNKYEAIIMFYNRKYNYNMDAAKPAEQKKYASMQRGWENLRVKRDAMKAQMQAA